MLKNICLFQARWLEDERFKHWISKKMALLQYAIIDVSVANTEEAALTSHMKGKKHVERSPFDQCIKSLITPTPAPTLITLQISLESGVFSSKLSS